jgi:nucleoside-diphosphate-sugar epimerase
LSEDQEASSGERQVVITGATGYIGARVLRKLDAAGVGWTALSRAPPASPSTRGRHIPFHFGEPLGTSLDQLPRVDAVIHLAGSTGTEPGDESAEVASLEALLSIAGARGARFIFASSQTAAADAPTGYGRLKFTLEKRVKAEGGVSVRIGMVYGGPERGLFGALCASARKLPLLPRFLPEPRVHPIHVDDLAQMLVHLALARGELESRYELGSPQSIPFSQFLRAIARGRVRRRRIFAPIPAFLVTRAVRLLASSGLPVPEFLRRLGSLLGLPGLPRAEEHLALLGAALRTMEDGMSRSGSARRRTLASEGARLLRAACGACPSSLIRRYVRALERSGAKGTAADAAERRRRMLVALRILEASPLGAEQMIALRRESITAVAARLCAAFLADAAAWIRDRIARHLSGASRGGPP